MNIDQLQDTYLELLVQALYIILNTLDELCLVLSDGTTNMRAHKQGIEARENAEHFVGILGRSQLVPQTSSDAGLDNISV